MHKFDCPKCNTELIRATSDLGQWKCPKCNFSAECRRCRFIPVHPHRKWQICLDCLVDIMIEQGSLEIPNRFKESSNDVKSNKKITIKRKGAKTNEL